MAGKDVKKIRGSAAPLDVPAIEVEQLASEGREQLITRGQAYAREYARVVGAQTTLLKNLAAVTVALKLQHQAWGRATAGEYKQAVSEIYDASGLTGDDRERFSAAIRYHVGNHMRRYMTPRAIERLGLQAESPLDRSRTRREETRALVRAARAEADAAQPRETAGQQVKATADHILLGQAARNVLDKISTDVIDEDMTPGQCAKLDDHLAAIQKRVTQLRRHTKKRRSAP